jgi:hypothetical protein
MRLRLATTGSVSEHHGSASPCSHAETRRVYLHPDVSGGPDHGQGKDDAKLLPLLTSLGGPDRQGQETLLFPECGEYEASESPIDLALRGLTCSSWRAAVLRFVARISALIELYCASLARTPVDARNLPRHPQRGILAAVTTSGRVCGGRWARGGGPNGCHDSRLSPSPTAASPGKNNLHSGTATRWTRPDGLKPEPMQRFKATAPQARAVQRDESGAEPADSGNGPAGIAKD